MLCTHCGCDGAPPIDPTTAYRPSPSETRTNGVLRTVPDLAPSVQRMIHWSPTSSLGSVPLVRSYRATSSAIGAQGLATYSPSNADMSTSSWRCEREHRPYRCSVV